MVLSIRTPEKVISIPGCLPGGVVHSSSRLLLMGELLLVCHSTVCTVCMSVGVCSLIRVSFGFFLDDFFAYVCCWIWLLVLFKAKFEVENIVWYSTMKHPTGFAPECRMLGCVIV